MRLAFTNSLIKVAQTDENIFLLTGDLGYGVLEGFIEKFPDRFFNMGVAEQNMIGTAAGLALSGKIPYVFSIATFPIMRGLEQIRNDVCYQNANVKIIGVGSGLTYSLYGATHQPIDDIAMTRALPNMVVISPGDPIETKLAVEFSAKHQGPVYIRIAAKGEPDIHSKEPKFELGKGIIVDNGDDVTLFVTGNMLANAKDAAQKLEEKGISVRLISMPFIKPIDKKVILEAAKETKAIFTIEEHNIIGGLGTAIAEVLAESDESISFKRIALPDAFPSEIGGWAYLRKLYGLSPEGMVETVFKKYNEIIKKHESR